MKIQVIVKPSSGKQEIKELEDCNLLVYLKSSATKGKANQELVKILVKKHLVTQFHIMIKHGLSSKSKLIQINR